MSGAHARFLTLLDAPRAELELKWERSRDLRASDDGAWTQAVTP